MERLETRELGYFVAVAQELHFGRAAGRLGIAQPPLSRAIQRLERKLGVRLFTRTSQRVALTEAGEVLLHEAQRVLAAADAAASRTQRAGKRSENFVVAMKPGIDHGLLPAILSAFAADPAGLPVDIVVGGVGEQTPMIRQGRADVAFVHEHTDLAGLDTVEFLVESQVLLVPQGHRLARRASVRMRDVRDEPLPCWPADRPNIRDVGQLMQLVCAGIDYRGASRDRTPAPARGTRVRPGRRCRADPGDDRLAGGQSLAGGGGFRRPCDQTCHQTRRQHDPTDLRGVDVLRVWLAGR
ncbi:LysR family transcriptional regulator [Fodinicola feengrottensis]|nr:LysR family transcriptional regulator [Fodinicola feengrottensis]